ncbi:MAG: hypothetical protein B6D61_06350 [Bacteroidetes bacterium 4484_249]|nr:MAG: hypothetical protein B6D61_06350 [Bacteroidetes bacterium 4484_249]
MRKEKFFGGTQNKDDHNSISSADVNGRLYAMAAKKLYNENKYLLQKSLSDSVLSDEEIEEIFHSTIMDIIKKLSKSDKEIYSVKNYLQKVFNNKKKKKYEQYFNKKLSFQRLSKKEYEITDQREQDENELKKDAVENIYGIAEMFNSDCREIFRLYYFELEGDKNKHTKIASELNISKSNSATKLKRCLDFVRKYYKNEN